MAGQEGCVLWCVAYLQPSALADHWVASGVWVSFSQAAIYVISGGSGAGELMETHFCVQAPGLTTTSITLALFCSGSAGMTDVYLAKGKHQPV